MKKKSLILSVQLVMFCALFALIMSNVSCSSRSEEDLIRESIKKAAAYVEDNDLERTMEYISPDYTDDRERTVEDIAQLLESYLGKYRGIAINLLSIKITGLNPPEADIETDLGLSSGALQAFRTMSKYAGYFYRFKLKLNKSAKTWQVKSASWEQISQRELNKEAAENLKKLFPNL